ncbi:MAG: hypothetical protein P1V81_10395 [Planctomycetota bacterium]|nr:hypothetical protein [Planctomycetota bacterium]
MGAPGSTPRSADSAPASSRSLLLVGGCLVATCLALAFLGPFQDSSRLALPLMLVAGGLWALALGLGAGREAPLTLVLSVAVALRVVFLAGDLGLSDDVWRYVWEGGLVLEGKSPYAWAPDDPALASEREAWATVHDRMNNTTISAAYPPVTQAAAAVLTFAAGGAEEADRGRFAMRLGFTLADLAVLAGLLRLLRRRGLPRGRALIWAWSPLVAWEFAGSGHFDSLGIALLVAGLLALEPGRRRDQSDEPREGPAQGPARAPAETQGDPTGTLPKRRLALGALALAAAFHVKLLPMLAFPFVVRRAGGALLAALLLAGLVLLAAPVVLLEGGLSGAFAGLSEYGLRWEAWNLGFRWIEPLFDGLGVRDGGATDPRRLARLFVAAALALFGLRLFLRRVEPVAATALCLAGYLLLTPTLHPWYLTWLVALLAFLPGGLARPWLWLAVASPILYLPLVGWHAEGVWQHPAWTWPVVAVPFYLLLLAGLPAVERALGRRS